jgi:hypothetical protein
MSSLKKCTLCDDLEDPRWGLSHNGIRYPLCDGCAPEPGREAADGRVNPSRDSTCVVCGYTGDGGTGRWACHVDEDCTSVCCGQCWRTYQRDKGARKMMDHWNTMLEMWGVQ